MGSLIDLVEILGVVVVVSRVAGWYNTLVGSGSAIRLTVVTSTHFGKKSDA